MTDGEQPITSRSAFRTELTALLKRSLDGGLDVRGGWEWRNGDGRPDYDVVITEVRSNVSSGSAEDD